MIYIAFLCLLTIYITYTPAPFNVYDETSKEMVDLSAYLSDGNAACPDIVGFGVHSAMVNYLVRLQPMCTTNIKLYSNSALREAWNTSQPSILGIRAELRFLKHLFVSVMLSFSLLSGLRNLMKRMKLPVQLS